MMFNRQNSLPRLALLACLIVALFDSTALAGADPPATPTLLTPLAQATGVPLSTELRFTYPATATRFNVQVATDAGMANKVLDVNVPPGPVAFSGAPATAYYWRVQAENADGFSAYTPVRMFTTVETVPDRVVLKAPANGATDVMGDVKLMWMPASLAQRYDVQVAMDPGFADIIFTYDTPGTYANFSPPTPGATYYWRVQAYNPKGFSPVSRTWSFTTFNPRPTVPTLASPANGSTDLATDVSLQWNRAEYAERYDMQVATDSMFANIVYKLNTPGLRAEFAAPYAGATYYWRVQTFGSGGASPGFSDVWMFSVGSVGSLVPTDLDPADGATGVPVTPLLMWGAPDDENLAYYHVQVATNETFETLVIDEDSLEETSYQVVDSLEYETVYCWRVAGVDTDGNFTFSPSNQFTTTAAVPGVVTLISPEDGAEGVAAYPEFSWGEVDGATIYQLQVSTDESFETDYVVGTELEATAFTFTEPFDYSTTFYWRVRAGNENGFGQWSAVFSFTVAIGTATDLEGVPSDFALHETYPNPFNPATTIRYDVPEQTRVRLTVYDALGRIVDSLVDGPESPGSHSIVWDAGSAPSGVYFVRMQAGDFARTQRMMLVK